MNDRQRFHATMHYQQRDRCPLYDFSFWDETLPTWQGQGLPKSVTRRNAAEYFGLDLSLGAGGRESAEVHVSLAPYFKPKVIEDRGDHEVVQQGDGVRVLRKKFMGSIPMHQGHLLVDRASWRKHYKPRLNPDSPRRWPAGWEKRVARWNDPGRDHMLALPGGSLYGWLRNWMGLENISMVVYDDPAWFEEMVTTIADCIVGVHAKVLAAGARFDGCSMWEDMCFNNGPLLGPEHFRKFLVPQYQRITSQLRRHGIDVCWVDCDGMIDDLLPLWLEAGVNCMFPVEVGTWGGDPLKFRAKYGKELLMMGGFDKHVLQDSPRAIEREIDRLTPLVEEGGFIPMPDHRVPPDVTLESYLFYCRTIRRRWGKGVNLPPMGAEKSAAVGAVS